MNDIKNKRILMIGPFDRSGGVSTHTKSLIKELEKKGATVHRINTLSRLGWRPDRKDPLTLLDNAYKIFKWTFILPVKMFSYRKRTDLVHIQTSGPLGGFIPGILGSYFCRWMGLPCVLTFHYSKTDMFVDSHPAVLRRTIGRVGAFIVVSRKQAEKLKSILPEKDHHKIAAIPNGFDPDRFPLIAKDDAKTRLGLQGKKVIVNVAWVMEKKGHIYLIDAVEGMVKDGHNDLKCFIIGQGPLLEKLGRTVHERNLNGHIRFLGFLPHDDMVSYMNAADLFVISSLNEGNPIVMFEALGLGKPIVSTDVGGIPEIIGSENIGLLVRPADPSSLKVAIEKGLLMEWDEKSLIEYSQNFTWEKIVNATMGIYRITMEGRGG